MPYANLGDEKSNEYFADGVTDELIELLSRMSGLRVTPRTSSLYFKGKPVQAAEAARQLGVSYLVDGSVRRAGERVRIRAQLTSAVDGAVMWSKAYDRELKDVLTVQTELTLGIGGSLKDSLDTSYSLGGTGSTSPEAWLAFLEAERLPWNERGACQRTLDAYQRVLELDPKFVRAYIRLHDRGNEMANSGGEPRAVAGARSMKVLQAALRVDPVPLRSTPAPLRVLRARTLDCARPQPAVGEGVRSCPRAGCGKPACPVR